MYLTFKRFFVNIKSMKFDPIKFFEKLKKDTESSEKNKALNDMMFDFTQFVAIWEWIKNSSQSRNPKEYRELAMTSWKKLRRARVNDKIRLYHEQVKGNPNENFPDVEDILAVERENVKEFDKIVLSNFKNIPEVDGDENDW